MTTRARSGGSSSSGPGKVRIEDRDHGYAALRDRLDHIRASRISVGLHAKEGQEAHRGEAVNAKSPVTVLDIGTWAEFGIGQPERSWLRAWYDATNTKSREEIRTMLKAIVAGRISAEAGLNQLGARFVGEIQARIAQGIPPPNAPSTIAKKGSSTPLVNTGQFRSSITWSVEFGEHGEGVNAAAE